MQQLNLIDGAVVAQDEVSGKKLASIFAGFFIAAISGISWSVGDVFWVVLTILPVIYWLLVSAKWFGVGIIWTYYLVGSWGIPEGSVTFYALDWSIWDGVIKWLVAASVNTLPWLVFWRENLLGRVIWLPVVFLFSVLPPVGFVSWGSPLLAAGVLFPGMGMMGLFLLVLALLCVGLIVQNGKWRKGGVVVLSLVLLFSLGSMLSYSKPVVPVGWAGVDTYFGKFPSGLAEKNTGFDERLALVAKVGLAAPAGSVLVFPESIMGMMDEEKLEKFRDVSLRFARNEVHGLMGAELPAGVGYLGGERYLNVMMGLGRSDGMTFQQRIPVPIAMWVPFLDVAAMADWKGAGVVEVAGKRAIMMICYEQLLMWPIVVSMLNGGGDVLVGAGNGWWAKTTNILNIQRQSMEAMGRLFALPLLMSVNY